MCYKSMMRLCLSRCSHTILLQQRGPCARDVRNGSNEVVHVVLWYSVDVDFVPITIKEVGDFPGVWLGLPTGYGN